MNNIKVGIINYGISNIASVVNAFEALDASVKLIEGKNDFKGSSHIVLPGVGSFAKGMSNIVQMDLYEVIQKEAKSGKPFLGICLGMQMLAEVGEEVGIQNGLGLIPGRVIKLKFQNSQLKLPHMGWNSIRSINRSRILPLDFKDNHVYFAHSYIYKHTSKDWITAICNYGEEIPAILEKDNIIGFQFHPEKSQTAGLTLLNRFLYAQK